MKLERWEEQAAEDRLEGWELAEFLQIPTSVILQACYDHDLIDEDNVEDLRDFIGLQV